MVTIYQDPAELAEFAGRGDPPIELWPGSARTRLEVMASMGDPRDWFRYHWKLAADEQLWKEFADARARRRNITAGFDWDQILIIGPYGARKSTLAALILRDHMRQGHPVFTNASFLSGWHLGLEEMYTAMPRVPLGSLMLFDEASATHNRILASNTAVSTSSEINLNTRKKLVKAIYTTAHDWEVASSIRMECKQVWKLIPQDELKPAGGERLRLPPAEDPDNFMIAWYVWDDFPYQKSDIIEGRKPGDKYLGFGTPDSIQFDSGENVRNAFLLTDTFQLAMSGAARTADREVIKSDVAAILDGRSPGSQNGRGGKGEDHDHEMAALLDFFLEDPDPPEFYRPADVAKVLAVDVRTAGQIVKKHFPVSNVQRKGYPQKEIMDHIEKRMEVLE